MFKKAYLVKVESYNEFGVTLDEAYALDDWEFTRIEPDRYKTYIEIVYAEVEKSE